MGFVLRRILKQEPMNRTAYKVRIEKELVLAMKMRGMDLNDTVNIALERHLEGFATPILSPVATQP